MQVMGVGTLASLPEGFNKIYYAPASTYGLFSIGAMCRKGARAIQDKSGLSIFDDRTYPPKLIAHTATLSNNLSPVTSDFLAVPEALVVAHYSPEQVTRMEAAETLHRALGHANDRALGDGLTFGHIKTEGNITMKDVVLNRLVRGHCPQCAEGHLPHPPYPPSTDPPAEEPGQVIYCDLEELPTATIDGFTHQLMLVDGKTGYYGIQGIKSKAAQDVAKGLQAYLATNFYAYKHVTKRLVCDGEAVFYAVMREAGQKLNIEVTCCPPRTASATTGALPPNSHETVQSHACKHPLHLLQAVYSRAQDGYRLRDEPPALQADLSVHSL
jgi:hypothetical protein